MREKFRLRSTARTHVILSNEKPRDIARDSARAVVRIGTSARSAKDDTGFASDRALTFSAGSFRRTDSTSPDHALGTTKLICDPKQRSVRVVAVDGGVDSVAIAGYPTTSTK